MWVLQLVSFNIQGQQNFLETNCIIYFQNESSVVLPLQVRSLRGGRGMGGGGGSRPPQNCPNFVKFLGKILYSRRNSPPTHPQPPAPSPSPRRNPQATALLYNTFWKCRWIDTEFPKHARNIIILKKKESIYIIEWSFVCTDLTTGKARRYAEPFSIYKDFVVVGICIESLFCSTNKLRY